MVASKRTQLDFGEKSLEYYQHLKRELGGLPGRDLTNRELFLIAMAWGYHNEMRVEEFKHSATGVRLEYLKDEDYAIMAAIQYATTEDTETLLDMEQRLTIAEQYAEGGILLLAQMMDEPGEFARSFAADIKELAGLLKIG
ncbi:MAG: hypothetical protein GX113_01500 [Actinobacteria bacterium]|jgi:hypothetical protein|nr:hypothetical protein [Actinomycetota bacterium]